ncbi:MAG: hypothetical protein SFV15_00065 [Polyangiaceae bacterium]|nr:hypothetical protein [Polyangiaceae bacterium]
MPRKPAQRLRVSALWGETVLGTRELGPREGLALDGADRRGVARLPSPDDVFGLPTHVFSPGPTGWRLDASGATGGFVERAGERVAAIGKPEVVLTDVGDFGVLEYGTRYALFFQASTVAPSLGRRLRPSLVTCLAGAFSCSLLLGVLLLVRALTLPVAAMPSFSEASLGSQLVHAEATLVNAQAPLLKSREAWLAGNEESTRQLRELVGALKASSSTNTPAPAVKPQEPLARIAVWDRSASAIRVFGASQGLTEAQVNRTLGAHMDTLQACLSTQEAPGQIVVRINAEPDGAIASATMTHSSLGNPATERCVLREARRLSLPAATRPTTAHLILVMRKN